MDDDHDQLRRIHAKLDRILGRQAEEAAGLAEIRGLLGEIQAGLDRLEAVLDRIDRQAALMGEQLTARLRATNRSLAA
jgi:predicted metal-dependent enzyme (double-stranded beta helix superfamily)